MTQVISVERAVSEGASPEGLRSIAKWHDRIVSGSKSGKGKRISPREIDRHNQIARDLYWVADELEARLVGIAA